MTPLPLGFFLCVRKWAWRPPEAHTCTPEHGWQGMEVIDRVKGRRQNSKEHWKGKGECDRAAEVRERERDERGDKGKAGGWVGGWVGG